MWQAGGSLVHLDGNSNTWRAWRGSDKSKCNGASLHTGTGKHSKSWEHLMMLKRICLFLEAQGFWNIKSVLNLSKLPSPIESGVSFLQIMWSWCPSFRKGQLLRSKRKGKCVVRNILLPTQVMYFQLCKACALNGNLQLRTAFECSSLRPEILEVCCLQFPVSFRGLSGNESI